MAAPAQRLALSERAESVLGFLPAAAVPPLFLHAMYQPSVDVGSATVTLADVAIWVVALAAVWVLVRERLPWVQPPWLVALVAATLGWLVLSLAWGKHVDPTYPVGTNVVSAGKFVEYALLFAAVPVLLRTARDLRVFLGALVAWSALASLVGLLEFFGVHIFIWGATAGRQASFLGFSDFSALSGATFLIGIASLTSRTPLLPRAWPVAAVVSGALGLFFAGALAGVVGAAVGAATIGVLRVVRGETSTRALVVAAAVVVVVAAGTVALRSVDLRQFAAFSSDENGKHPQAHVQTYAHRTLLGYLGVRIFRDHPLLGVGWQGTLQEPNFRRYFADARRRYPEEPPVAYPSRTKRYGVQNAYIQLLADLGILGFVLAAATFVGGFVVGARRAVTAAAPEVRVTAVAWLVLLAALWAGQSLVPGIPLDVLTWTGLGLAAAELRGALA